MTSHNIQSGAGKKPKCARRETIQGKSEFLFNGKTQSELISELRVSGSITDREFYLLGTRAKDFPKTHPRQILNIIDKQRVNHDKKKHKRHEAKKNRDVDMRDKRREKLERNTSILYTESPQVECSFAKYESDLGFLLTHCDVECNLVIPNQLVTESGNPDEFYKFQASGQRILNDWIDYEDSLINYLRTTLFKGNSAFCPSMRWWNYLFTILIYSVSGGANRQGFVALFAMISHSEGKDAQATHSLHLLLNVAISLCDELRAEGGKSRDLSEENAMETEGKISDAMSSLKDNAEYYISSSIVGDFLTTISHLASHRLFDANTAKHIFEYLKPKPVERVTKPALFVMVWKHVTQLVAVAESMWAGASLYDAIGQFVTLESLELLESRIVSAYPNVYPGIPPEGCYTEQYVYSLACDYIQRAESRLLTTQRSNKNYAKYNTSLELIKGIRAKLDVVLKGRIRYTPFGVILFGESQIGKSYFIKYLQKQFLEVFNIPYDPGMVYNRDYLQEHWEKYFGHPIVFYSELGTTAEPIAAKTGDPGVAEFCSLIDNNEKQLSMAFEGKGCTPFRSLGVFGDGNNFDPNNKMVKHLNIEYTVSNPGAVANRFIFPTMVVKEEYRLPNSMSLDTDKARLNPDRWFDIYDFEVYESEKKSFKTMSFRKTFRGNIDEFDVFYKNKILKHFVNQQKAQENVQRALSDEVYGASAVFTDPVEKITRTINSVFESVYNVDQYEPLKFDELRDGMRSAKSEIRDWIDKTSFIQDHHHVELLRKAIIAHLSKDKDFRVRELAQYICEEDFSSLILEKDNNFDAGFVGQILHSESPNHNEEEKELQVTSLYCLRQDIPVIDWTLGDVNNTVVQIPKEMHHCQRYLETLTKELHTWIDNSGQGNDYIDLTIKHLMLLIQGCQAYIAHLQMARWSQKRVPQRTKNRLEVMQETFKNASKHMKSNFLGALSTCKSYVNRNVQKISDYVKKTPSYETALTQLFVIWFFMWFRSTSVYQLMSQFSIWQYALYWFPLVLLLFSKVGWFMYTAIFLSYCVFGYTLLSTVSAQNTGLSFSKHLEMRRRKFIAEQLLRARAGIEVAKTVVKPLFFTVTAVSIAGICTWFLSRKKKNDPVPDSLNNRSSIPDLRPEGAFMSTIQDIEEKTDCSPPYPRVRNKRIPSQWNAVNTAITGGATCSNMAQFYDRVCRGRRKMLIRGKSIKTGATIEISDCIGFGFKNYFLFPRHYLSAVSEGEIYLFSSDGKSGKTKVADLSNLTMCKLHTDLCAIKIYTFSFPDFSGDFPSEKMSYFRGKLMGVDVDCTLSDGMYVKDTSNDALVYYADIYTYGCKSYKGLCGELLLTNIKNKYFIMGLHVAGDQKASGAAVPITKEYIDRIEGFFDKDILVPLPVRPITAPVDDAVLFNTEGAFNPIPVRIEPHDKSCVNYEVLEYLQYHGRDLSTVSFPSKSDVTPTGLDFDVVTEIFNDFGMFPTKKFVPPMMKSTRVNGVWTNPINVNIRDMDRPDVMLDVSVCKKVIEEIAGVYVNRIKKRKGNEFKLNPLLMEHAINGMAEDQILRKIDPSKAGGYGYPGKKSKYFVEYEGKLYPCEQLEKDVAKVLWMYNHDRTCPQIFKGTLKDEPRSESKFLTGSTRMFFASSLAHLIVQRMYLAPLMTLKLELEGIFNSEIGIDTHRDMHKFLKRFADKSNQSVDEMMEDDEALETDYGGFDKETCTMVTSCAYTIVAEICKRLGYNVEAHCLLSAMLSDMIVCYFCVDGDIYSRPGIFGSGQYATAELNDFRNTFMIVYALHFLVYPYVTVPERVFEKILEHSTYGDDLLGYVYKAYRHLFNNVTYAEFCLKHFGVRCTPANKENALLPFIPFKEASFLKRTFRKKYDLDNKYVGLLDPSSIRKTLLWYIPSDVIGPLLQWKQMVESCMRELFFHLDERDYELFGKRLMSHINTIHGVNENWIPHYQTIRSSLMDETLVVELPHARTLRGALEVNNTQVSDMQDAMEDRWLQPTWGSPTSVWICFDLLDFKLRARLCENDSSRIVATYGTKRIAASVKDTHVGDFKSGEISQDVIETHQNLTDVSATRAVEHSELRGTDIKLFSPVDVGLEDFLSRPIQISSYAIAHAADSSVVLNPWDLYLAEPSVRAKLKNYGFMRATLKTKTVVSGTPFHQGSLLISRILYPGQIDSVVAYAGGSAFATRAMFLKYLSQTKDRGIVNLHDNIPFELKFPFVNVQPIGRLFDNSSTAAMPAASNFPDFTPMAKMYLYTLNQQFDTSGSATDVYVYVYAWLEDVILGCPTASPYVLTTEMPDERVIGPVERFTSAAARYSRYFVDIPFIAPFAKASEIAFGAISSVSAIFGWSVPTVIEKPQRMKNEPLQNACQLIGYDTGQRLTLDPKQEVTVDPAVFGVAHDELAIRHLSKIESLLDQFSWSTSAASMTPLWKTMVTPNARTPIVGATTRKIQPTVIDYITLPFRFWRGDIKFKIQVICTQFHRGKFAIIYEPDITKDALVVANLKLNKQFIKIVDISETQEVEFCINWATNKLWAPVLASSSDQTTGSTITTSQLPAYSSYVNGMIYLVPITKLQAPNATAAQINVFISCDNLRVCYPDASGLPKTMLLTEAPSGIEVGEMKEDMTMTPTTCMVLNPVHSNDSDISHLTFGEEVHSFRALLKKFFYTDALSNAATAPTIHQIVFRSIPVTIPTPTTNNVTISNLFAHLRLCYLGMRGGLRKRFDFFGSQSATNDSIRIALEPPTGSTTTPAVTVVANDTSPNSLTGTVWFLPSTNAGLETEVPFYTNNLFYFASNDNNPISASVANMEVLSNRNYKLTSTIGVNSAATVTYREWTAAAEDFSFGYFVAVPYYRSL